MESGRVMVDELQKTSVDGVFAAGEVTGIGGLELSLVEGEIAGFSAGGRAEQGRLRFPARLKHRRFAEQLEAGFPLRDELKHLADAETVVCRCEDVTCGQLDGCEGWREAKLYTRCGMGPCQGRVCGAALAFLRGWDHDSVRPPVFPARIESLSTQKER
jgi:aspartate oxidase